MVAHGYIDDTHKGSCRGDVDDHAALATATDVGQSCAVGLCNSCQIHTVDLYCTITCTIFDDDWEMRLHNWSHEVFCANKKV